MANCENEEIIRVAQAAGIAYAMKLIEAWKDAALEDVGEVAKASCDAVNSLNGQEALVERSIRDAIDCMYEACEEVMDREMGRIVASPLMKILRDADQSSMS